MNDQQNAVVSSPVGERPVDSTGSPVGVVRVDPSQSYVGIPQLLQSYINENSAEAWDEIRAKIDYTYDALDHLLSELERRTGFAERVRGEVAKGKKVLFKPNLVYPACIDPVTHGPDQGTKGCTEWQFVAAVMRWFHDKLGVTYHQMCVGEGGSGSDGVPSMYNLHHGKGRTFSSEATREGKCGGFYGGWGFYFARKYLVDTHDSSHTDDPMQGHEECVAGVYIPPGRATDKLMVYDTNRTYDDDSKARDISVPDGANFQTITVHKAYVGGNPEDAADMKDYPGCVLVSLPKLKVHSNTLITGAVKNLGIGLYPMQAAETDPSQGRKWKYGFPKNGRVPILANQIPHNVWQAVTDPMDQPITDQAGNYVFRRTAGLDGTMADMIKAVQASGTILIHVVDGVECINLDHTTLAIGVKVPEGLVVAGLDPVAIDLMCVRYLFKTVPMAQATRLKEERNIPSESMQKVPVPRFDGRNIVTEEGYDSPIPRDPTSPYTEARGLGKQEYHVFGSDLTAKAPLVSLDGHLGRIEDGKFNEVITATTYMDVAKFLWDMQVTVMAYAAANDAMSGTSLRKSLLETYDENGDGIIDINERGRLVGGEGPIRGELIRCTEKYGFLRGPFFAGASMLKLRRADWNQERVEMPVVARLGGFTYMALQLSKMPAERPDPFVPGLSFGQGKWPSIQLVEYVSMSSALYGPEFPAKVGPVSLYGLAVAYADKLLNGGTYTGSRELATDPRAVDKYLSATAEGAPPLDFILYVPRGWGNVGSRQLPNVEETDDPAKVLTASFGQGREVW